MSIVFQIQADNEVDQSKRTTQGHRFKSRFHDVFHLHNKCADNDKSQYGLSQPHDGKE